MRAGCGLAGPGPTRATRGRAAVSTPVDPPTRYGADGRGRGQRCSPLRAAGRRAVRAGAAGSLVRAVHPAGAGSEPPVLLRPSSGPGSAALAVPLNPLGARSARVRLRSPSSPRPSPAPPGRRLFPGRLPPPVIPRRDGFPLAGALLPVRSAESRGTPVEAARRVLSRIESAAPPRRLALAGSRASRTRVVRGEGHVPGPGGR